MPYFQCRVQKLHSIQTCFFALALLFFTVIPLNVKCRDNKVQIGQLHIQFSTSLQPGQLSLCSLLLHKTEDIFKYFFKENCNCNIFIQDRIAYLEL